MDAYVVGIDGCHSGWLTCRYEIHTRQVNFRIVPSFDEVLRFYETAKFIAIDIPIGLWNDGQHRCCDVEARRLLAPHRSSCVFPAPCRSLLDIQNYTDACEISRERFGGGISKQSYAIYPKVAEVDRLISPKLQERVFEVHPELCFWGINHRRALLNSKRTRKGYEDRRLLLNEVLGIQFPDSLNWRSIFPDGPVNANRDDVLDAAVAAHTAYRAFLGKAERLPQQPAIDERGLRMEMLY